MAGISWLIPIGLLSAAQFSPLTLEQEVEMVEVESVHYAPGAPGRRTSP
jgi:hypothetical protein